MNASPHVGLFLDGNQGMRDIIEIHNKKIARRSVCRDSQILCDSIIHKSTGTVLPVSESGIWLRCAEWGTLTGEQFTWETRRQDRCEVVFEARGARVPLLVKLHYALADTDHFIRKRITIRNLGRKRVTLLRVNAEPLRILKKTKVFPNDPVVIRRLADSRAISPDDETGSPASAGEFFFGVEFPAYYNYFDSRLCLHLDTYPGKTIPAGGAYEVKPVVVGVGAEEFLRESFDQYLRTLRPYRADRLTVRLDAWMAFEPTLADGVAALDFIKRRLGDEHGILPDTFSLSWLNGLRHSDGQYRLDDFFIPTTTFEFRTF